LKTYEIWIDGRIYGTIRAANASGASQQAHELWEHQIKEATTFRIEEQ